MQHILFYFDACDEICHNKAIKRHTVIVKVTDEKQHETNHVSKWAEYRKYWQQMFIMEGGLLLVVS